MSGALSVDEIQRYLGSRPAWEVHVFDRLASTNTTALEWATSGITCGIAIVAEAQTAGRGRRGREWKTPTGSALALSAVVASPVDPERRPLVTLAAAVATSEAIESVADVRCRLKWPNDVLIGKRKVAGILVEGPRGEDHGAIQLVVGIGINVNNRAAALPTDVRDSATSLLEAGGRTIDRNRLAASLLERLSHWMGTIREEVVESGANQILERWAAASTTTGEYVSVTTVDGLIEGLDRGLDGLGHLVLEGRDGRRRAIHSGEVLLCRTSSPPMV